MRIPWRYTHNSFLIASRFLQRDTKVKNEHNHTSEEIREADTLPARHRRRYWYKHARHLIF